MASYFLCVFMCVLLTAFVEWEPKNVPWWLVGTIASLIVVTTTFVVMLWSNNWSFQKFIQSFHYAEDVIIWLFFFLVAPIVSLFLSAFVGSRTKQAWRVGVYAVGIFILSLLFVGMLIGLLL